MKKAIIFQMLFTFALAAQDSLLIHPDTLTIKDSIVFVLRR